MKYLFFDIECSDGSSMCSFGYVRTDESYNVEEKEDVLMNPKSYFHTGAWGKKNRESAPGIELAYPESVFRRRGEFPDYYEHIKSVLTAPDQMIIGFSMGNDVMFLEKACRRYKLPYIEYKFFDVQNIYLEQNELKNQVSLEKLLDEFGIDTNKYTLHKSDDDAEVSMLVAKSLCLKSEVGMPKLCVMYKTSAGEVREGKPYYFERERRKAEQLAAAALNSNRMTERNRRIFSECARSAKPSDGKPFSGLKFCVSLNYEHNHFKEMLYLVRRLAECGAKYTPVASESDVFVTFNPEKKCVRLEYVRKALENGKSIRVVELEDFLRESGVSAEELDALPIPDTSSFSDKRRPYKRKHNFDKEEVCTETVQMRSNVKQNK